MKVVHRLSLRYSLSLGHDPHNARTAVSKRTNGAVSVSSEYFGSLVERHHSRNTVVIAFTNPRSDGTFFHHADHSSERIPDVFTFEV